MARYTEAVCKLCRREGQKLFLKGERCYTDKCAISRRAYAPGQHGQGRKKTSEYGLQLRAKQMTRRFYGVLEGQFHHYYEMATKMPGKAGDNLLILLESRLDNVVYRCGWANSRLISVSPARLLPLRTAAARAINSRLCWKLTPPGPLPSGWT